MVVVAGTAEATARAEEGAPEEGAPKDGKSLPKPREEVVAEEGTGALFEAAFLVFEGKIVVAVEYVAVEAAVK